MKSQSGFTLLEAMIAIGILAIGIGSILVAENNSLDSTIRAKRMTTVATLARNKIIDTERQFEGKTFDEVKKEDEGKFDAPYADYTWVLKIKEITFPNLLDPSQSAGSADGKEQKKDDTQAVDQNVERVVKIATNYLSKSSREVNVTVKWKEKGENQQFSVSQYWVDLNHEFNFSEE